MGEVDDLLQDTFARAYRAFHQFRGGNPKAWLLQIARNLTIDYLRQRGRDKRIDSEVLFTMSASTETPEEAVVAIKETRWLLTCLDAVNPKFSRVLLVRGIQELSSKDAARVLGWSVSTVNVTYHRALKAARQIILESEQREGAERV